MNDQIKTDMSSDYRIGCVLMAAGSSARFHSNKLLAQYNGRTLYERALSAIPEEEFYQVAVVTQYDELMAPARARGFRTIRNDHPEAGLSHTVALGIGALEDADALVFMVADQPLLRKQSVKNLLALHRANREFIVAMAFGEQRGNPCVFPRTFFPALFSLTGDRGGRTVIDANEDKLLLCYAQDGRELADVDTVEGLMELIR